MLKSAVLFVAAALGACVFEGCSHSTSPNGSAIFFQSPGAGSHFVFLGWDIDSMGHATPNDLSLSQTVVASGIAFAGKSNCTKLVDDSDATNDLYIVHEPNGDLSVFDQNYWQLIPTGSQLPVSQVHYDTSSPGEIRKREVKWSYVGTEDLSVAGHTFHTVKLSCELHSWTNGVDDGTYIPNLTYWFAEETGWYVQVDFLSYDHNNNLEPAGKIALESYTLK